MDLDYRNLNVQFLPWPLQVRSGKPGLPIPYYYNKIVRDRNHRNDFIDHVFNRLEADKALGPKSLVVCPMVIHSDMDERLSMYRRQHDLLGYETSALTPTGTVNM